MTQIPKAFGNADFRRLKSKNFLNPRLEIRVIAAAYRPRSNFNVIRAVRHSINPALAFTPVLTQLLSSSKTRAVCWLVKLQWP